MARLKTQQKPWWQTGIIYQVYPRSFQDSNGDGIGDIPGITRRLDYLEWLGVDAIWLSPIFRSPMADFGYDVADYTDVDSIFGRLADLDALVKAAHRRGIKVLLDFVPNHSSDQHPWFQESRSSRDNSKRDWYLWADAKPDGSPPNNWLSSFGGPAWTWDERTGAFYGHSFLKEQPDLNWRNPEVRATMYDVLRFWMKRGIDGFRVDVLWLLVKDDQLRDNPPNPAWKGTDPLENGALLPVYTADRPEIHGIVEEMRAVLGEFDDRIMIGEIYLPLERLVAYYGADASHLGTHLPFNFQLLSLPWKADSIATAIAEYEKALPPHGWPNWVLGNHDQTRIASRVGPEQARVAAMLLLTLRGTPTMYYGDEIGMADVNIPPELQQDPARFHSPGRDPERTPMRWDSSANAGFTTGTPWLPVGDAMDTINVSAQRDDPASMLSLVRRLITVRREQPALTEGAWSIVSAGQHVLAYERTVPAKRLLIVLNLGSGDASLAPTGFVRGKILVSTQADRDSDDVGSPIHLRSNEGLLVEYLELPRGPNI